MNNVEIAVFKKDARPAFVLDDVQGTDFFRLKAPHPSGVPTFTLHNLDDFSIARSKPVTDTEIQHVDHKDL